MPSKTLGDLEREYYETNRQSRVASDYAYASATALAGLANSVSLPAVADKTNYLLGFIVTATNPAAAASGIVTVTGLGTTLSFQLTESTTQGSQLKVVFPEPLPASAVNTAITVAVPAITGGGATAVAVFGFKK